MCTGQLISRSPRRHKISDLIGYFLTRMVERSQRHLAPVYLHVLDNQITDRLPIWSLSFNQLENSQSVSLESINNFCTIRVSYPTETTIPLLRYTGTSTGNQGTYRTLLRFAHPIIDGEAGNKGTFPNVSDGFGSRCYPGGTMASYHLSYYPSYGTSHILSSICHSVCMTGGAESLR